MKDDTLYIETNDIFKNIIMKNIEISTNTDIVDAVADKKEHNILENWTKKLSKIRNITICTFCQKKNSNQNHYDIQSLFLPEIHFLISHVSFLCSQECYLKLWLENDKKKFCPIHRKKALVVIYN